MKSFFLALDLFAGLFPPRWLMTPSRRRKPTVEGLQEQVDDLNLKIKDNDSTIAG